jgi:uncharacterized membrane protein YjjP (DUF1212 family)
MRLGLLMLRNGTSSSRADEAMRRLGATLGADRVEPYVTPTGIICSVFHGAEGYTQIARIRALGVNMQRVYAMELLIRRLKPGTSAVAVDAELDQIEHAPPTYPPWVVALACGIGCGAFAFLRGGGPLEFVAAFIGATLAQGLRMRLTARQLSVVPVTVLCAMLASGIGIILVRALGAPSPEIGVVASVLLLVPGAPLVTALLDLLNGNLVSGMARAMYTVIIFIAIGVGVLVMLTVFNFKFVLK